MRCRRVILCRIWSRLNRKYTFIFCVTVPSRNGLGKKGWTRACRIRIIVLERWFPIEKAQTADRTTKQRLIFIFQFYKNSISTSFALMPSICKCQNWYMWGGGWQRANGIRSGSVQFVDIYLFDEMNEYEIYVGLMLTISLECLNGLPFGVCTT